jgi:hypothetical protein
MRRLSVVGVNISHSGTMNDPNLGAYLRHRGISDEAVHQGRRFVFADGSIAGFTTSNAFKAAAFPQTNAAHDPAVVHAIAGPAGQPERYSWLSLRSFVGDGGLDAPDDATKLQRVEDAYLQVIGHWEFSVTLPHVLGNSSHYAQQADGSWTAMSRRDRQVWTADAWQQSSPNVEAERERALRYMEDLKAFLTDGANQARFRSRIALWRRLRRAADRGRWDRIAAIVEDEHARDPGFGEALARDVVGALHFGRPLKRPGFVEEDLMRVRRAAPVAPWLVQRLRALPVPPRTR